MSKTEFEKIADILSKGKITKEDFNILMNNDHVKSVQEKGAKRYAVELTSGDIFYINVP